MSKLIPLTKGYEAIVNDEDFEWLSQFSWQCRTRDTIKYASSNIRIDDRTVAILMHRLITNAPQDMQVDHINHNGLDNQRYNLRIVTRSQNLQNKRMSRGNTSGYKGVTQRKDGKWQVCIGRNNKNINLGTFTDPIEGAKAYDRAAIEYFGEFACLNFPTEAHQNTIAICQQQRNSAHDSLVRQRAEEERQQAEADAAYRQQRRDALRNTILQNLKPVAADELDQMVDSLLAREWGMDLIPAPVV